MCAGDIKFDANFVSVANEENGNVNDKKQVNSQKKKAFVQIYFLCYMSANTQNLQIVTSSTFQCKGI